MPAAAYMAVSVLSSVVVSGVVVSTVGQAIIYTLYI